jgi:hypothetical protein
MRNAKLEVNNGDRVGEGIKIKKKIRNKKGETTAARGRGGEGGGGRGTTTESEWEWGHTSAPRGDTRPTTQTPRMAGGAGLRLGIRRGRQQPPEEEEEEDEDSRLVRSLAPPAWGSD